MMTRDVNNTQDVIDSRDVIERITELTDERQDLAAALEEAREEADEPKEDEDTEEDRKAKVTEAELSLEEWDADNGDELKALQKLAEEGESTAEDWAYGATLVRESYFVDYCQEMLEDCGDLPKNLPAYLVIDWDATARNLRVDYSEVDFDGVTYFVR